MNSWKLSVAEIRADFIRTAHNVLDAAMMAATGAVQAIASILAMLICATAFLALFDGLLGFLGGLADLPKLTLAVRETLFIGL